MFSRENKSDSQKQTVSPSKEEEPKTATGLLIGTLVVGLGSGMGISALVTPADVPQAEQRVSQPAAVPLREDVSVPEEPASENQLPSFELPQYVRPDGSELQIEGLPEKVSAPASSSDASDISDASKNSDEGSKDTPAAEHSEPSR